MADISLIQKTRHEKLREIEKQASSLDASGVMKRHRQHLNPVLATIVKFLGTNVRFVHAEGTRLRDDRGREYRDFLSGFGALNLGHEPAEVLAALRACEKTPNILQASLNPHAALLGEMLAAVAPGGLCRSFFCSSGTEAVEAALKIARRATGRKILLSAEGAYHGKTFGALSVSGRKKYKVPFEPLVPDTESIPYDDLGALEARLSRKDVAAFIVEPIQGENGVIIPKEGYLKGVQELCRRYDTLLLADEVQTGMGRTGSLFCVDHEGVEPDVLILSKSLGGGVMPFGAIVTSDGIWKKAYGSMETGLLHSATFGGNTRACACAVAALKTIVEKDLSSNARRMGVLLVEGLRDLSRRYPVMREVRGRGLMIGLSFARFKGNHPMLEGALTLWIARQLVKRFGIITAFTLNNLDVLRISPPLIVKEDEIRYFLDSMEAVLKSTAKLGRFGLLNLKA